MTTRVWSVARVGVPSRFLVLAALLSLALAAALVHGLAAVRSASPTVAVATPGGHPANLTLAAQGQISAALGADSASYRVSVSRAGASTLHNPAQHLGATFSLSGLKLSSGAVTLGLGLREIGYGSARQSIAAIAPAAHANRVVYSHPQLSEWYVNGPLGLEQGFTIAHPPVAAAAAGPLTLSIALSGNARAAVAGDGRSVTFSHPGATPLRYGALSATDARGRTLHSWLTVNGAELRLHVDSTGASYPLRIDPTVQIVRTEAEDKLMASDESSNGLFGFSVALSADGNTALVGGPRDSTHFGAAWVFVRSGSSWTQQGPKLLGAEQGGEGSGGEHCGNEPGEEDDGCSFGRSIALSADGNTALIGNPRDSRFQPGSNGEPGEWVPNVGAAWVFTRSDGKWAQQGPKLTAVEEAGEGRFGKSVALSADGATALIGGSSDLAGHGAAWVLTRAPGGWAQQKITGAEEQGEVHFGGSVALSADGATALVGGTGDAGYAGAAWVFTRSESGWSQQGAKLAGGGESGTGRFGYRVALSGDGSTALIGGRGDNGNLGAAWMFARSGSTWSEQGPKLVGPAEENEEFGYSVALSSDGNVAIVGAPRADGAQGAAWLYQRRGTSWSEPAVALQASGEQGNASYGASVALSSDAQTALVGGPSETGAKGTRPGAVWAFGPHPAPLITGVVPNKGPAAGGTEVTVTGTNFTGVTAVEFGGDAATFTVNSATSITAVSPPGTGVVDVRVKNENGLSAVHPQDHFTYTSLSKPTTSGEGSQAPATLPEFLPSAGAVLAYDPTPGGAVCRVLLIGKGITVKTHGRAVVRLKSSGPGICSGRLRLLVSVRISRHRVKTKTIAAGAFTIAGASTRTVTLKLNATGRALLGRRHGRLAAKLTIQRLAPTPPFTQNAAVRLTLQKSRPAASHKK
jgi:hypothetical protein